MKTDNHLLFRVIDNIAHFWVNLECERFRGRFASFSWTLWDVRGVEEQEVVPGCALVAKDRNLP